MGAPLLMSKMLMEDSGYYGKDLAMASVSPSPPCATFAASLLGRRHCRRYRCCCRDAAVAIVAAAVVVLPCLLPLLLLLLLLPLLLSSPSPLASGHRR